MMKVWFILFIFLVGIGLGLGAPSVAPKYFNSYFPKSLSSSRAGVQGIVVKKQSEEDRLLLTISAPDGALLAIFQKKITEISLLVDEGDTVTLDVRVYAPFVTDPPILRVKKPNSSSPFMSDPVQDESPAEPVPSIPSPDTVPLESEPQSEDSKEPTVGSDTATESESLL